jgi:PAS domain S-box-containing protein
VLLVEDSENDAMLLLRELRRGGYKPLSRRVCTPEDMKEALCAADAADGPFEVVISDYFMPRFRAPDALRLLRDLGYDLPFIVVSGKIGEDAAVEIMKAGADDYVTKENMSRLCPAIERELREAQVRRDRERAEKELVRSEDRFRHLVEQIPAVTYVQEPIDSETPKAITYMSPQYEAMLGYPPEKEMLDEEHWLRVLHPDDRERVLAEELRTDETGEPYRIEYRQIARDGRVVWVRDEATLIRDEEGNPLYWLGVQYDITEQKRTEEELKQSEERFKVLSQEVVEGIVLSENGRIIDANRSVTEMFGYGLEELIGKDAIELTPPEYREMVMQRISEEDTRPYESVGLKRDGTVFPLEIRPRHLPYSGRRIRVTSVIDLTERMHQEEALRQSEALYRTVVEQAEENIFLVDAKSRRVLDANDALLRSLGYTEDELKEMTLYDIVAHPQESVDINIGRIMEEGHRSLGERQYRRKDGSLADVEVNVSAVPYDGEKVMCVVAHDVTERKQAERMLEEIREAERNRLARELHDSTLQDIVYALQEPGAGRHGRGTQALRRGAAWRHLRAAPQRDAGPLPGLLAREPRGSEPADGPWKVRTRAVCGGRFSGQAPEQGGPGANAPRTGGTHERQAPRRARPRQGRVGPRRRARLRPGFRRWMRVRFREGHHDGHRQAVHEAPRPRTRRGV